IFFFSTLRAWSTLLSRTRTCTRRSFSIEQLIGPMAKALGPLAHGQAQFECRWHPRYEATSIFELRRRWAPWLPIGRNGEFGTSLFLAALWTSQCSPKYTTYAKYWCVGDKEQ